MKCVLGGGGRKKLGDLLPLAYFQVSLASKIVLGIYSQEAQYTFYISVKPGLNCLFVVIWIVGL